MSTGTNHFLEALEGLRKSFKLPAIEGAIALITAESVQDAFRQYLNRCLKSTSLSALAQQLPDWMTVDQYIYAARRDHRNPERYIEKQCLRQPYESFPNAALFIFRFMRFLKSSGRQFDGPELKWEQTYDRDFSRCKRGLVLLDFLLQQEEIRRQCRSIYMIYDHDHIKSANVAQGRTRVPQGRRDARRAPQHGYRSDTKCGNTTVMCQNKYLAPIGDNTNAINFYNRFFDTEVGILPTQDTPDNCDYIDLRAAQISRSVPFDDGFEESNIIK
ncbi:hypothetical protein BKA67DRAFT_697388 [Truncatella angustata]|uniref:Uncharacterized protein n=1 Tax=Truncatella angustata TaxID=152316 RepID=A0A9P8U7S5_9PEZI|nr:uncharacterized protein BKA67DRAFT_697388 [Truncatella angustata]KAH6638676.1 hypothetical protein BKA67DRAFT_697388 [Truncatella angustata]